MLTDDQIVDALRAAFLRSTNHVQPSQRLVDSVSQMTRRRGRIRVRLHLRLRAGRRPPQFATLALGVLVAAILAAVVDLAAPPPQSFAVTRSVDGSIRVTIRDAAGVSGANRRLLELGVPVHVVLGNAACVTRAALNAAQDHADAGVSQESADTVTLMSAAMRHGYTLLIAARATQQSELKLTVGRAADTGSRCAGDVERKW